MIYYRFGLYKHTPNGRRENDTDELCNLHSASFWVGPDFNLKKKTKEINRVSTVWKGLHTHTDRPFWKLGCIINISFYI